LEELGTTSVQTGTDLGYGFGHGHAVLASVQRRYWGLPWWSSRLVLPKACARRERDGLRDTQNPQIMLDRD
jgi:hypothetical protein